MPKVMDRWVDLWVNLGHQNDRGGAVYRSAALDTVACDGITPGCVGCLALVVYSIHGQAGTTVAATASGRSWVESERRRVLMHRRKPWQTGEKWTQHHRVPLS